MPVLSNSTRGSRPGRTVLVQRSAAGQAVSAVGEPITRSEVLARARYWIDQYNQTGHPTYSQNASYPDPQGRNYRTDCAGYVSMAWHLSESRVVSNPRPGLLGVSHKIGWDELRPGDAVLLIDTHVRLFDHWTDSRHTSYMAYDFGETPIRHQTFNVDHSYDPYRYNNIIDGAANPSDVSGDGAGDVLAVKPDGSLWCYPNNAASNPGHLPFATGTQIGTGWDVYRQVMAADVSGDGAADVLAVKPDGSLWYYPNNGASNPGHLPFATGTQIGTGFDQFTMLVAADVSGDGFADVLAVKPDGSLWYYPNNAASNPDHLPFATGTQIGTGWDVYRQVMAADVSGDGFADMLAVKPDGSLWYYPNNAASNPGGLPFATGTQIGTGWDVYSQVMAADVSGDGAADVLAVKPDGSLWYYPNNAASNPDHLPFATGTQIGTGWDVYRTIF